jgi:putative ABC transport system permease protein
MMRLQGQEEDGWEIERQVEVVGVVKDYASGWLFGDPLRAVVYLPAQAGTATAPVLMLSLRDASASQLARLERECLYIAANAECGPVPMADALRVQRLPLTVASRLSASLAWLALCISCVGLYGLVSYAVVRQRKALGVRLALGAKPGDVVRHVMRGAAWPVLWGLLIGLSLAWGFGRLLAHASEHVLTFSVDAFVLGPLLLGLVALLASWLPARRSAKIPPSECLRSDG